MAIPSGRLGAKEKQDADSMEPRLELPIIQIAVQGVEILGIHRPTLAAMLYTQS